MRTIDTLTGSLVLDEIVAIIGIDATMALVRSFGGTRFYVPEGCSADHAISRAIGADAASRLAEHFHHTDVTIPIRLKRELEVRELAAREPRLTNSQIAKQAGIHERTVQNILARKPFLHHRRAPRSDPNQPGLFDD